MIITSLAADAFIPQALRVIAKTDTSATRLKTNGKFYLNLRDIPGFHSSISQVQAGLRLFITQVILYD